MDPKLVSTALAALVAAALPAGTAFAKGGSGGGGGGGGGGTTATTLTAPAIAPGTFDGIGSGPVYLHDSIGFAQRTRYKQNGDVIDVVNKPDINGIRAEYPNNKTETWSGTTLSGSASWKFGVVGPADPFEPLTALQQSDFGYQDGILNLVGAELGAPDTRPNALVPFAAPTGSASTVSGDTVAFDGKTAIGFSSSSSTNRNFESDGQAWIEVDATGNFVNGGNTGVLTWTFHTNGLSGVTLTGTYQPSPNGFNRLAVSYDPVDHVAAAAIDGSVVASVPYITSSVKYAGVEGSLHANIDNFSVYQGTVSDPMPAAIAAP